jgi:hypothetical protein
MKAAEEQQLRTRDCFNERAAEIHNAIEGVGRYYQIGVTNGKDIVKAHNWLTSTRSLFLDMKEEFDVASSALTFTDSINPPSWAFEFDGTDYTFAVLGQLFHCNIVGDRVQVSSDDVVGAFNVSLIWDKRDFHGVIDGNNREFTITLDHGHACQKILIQPRTFKDAFEAQCSLMKGNDH